jgi:hypothetical protein
MTLDETLADLLARISAQERRVTVDSTSQLPRPNVAINSRFRTNQRGYVSGTALGAGAFAVDRWRDARVTNLAFNPTSASAVTGWQNTGGTVTPTRLTGLTIPGLSGVTTCARWTSTAAAADGLAFYSGSTSPFATTIAGLQTWGSMWVRSSVAKTITFSLQFTGSGTVAITSASVALVANTWTLVSVGGVAPVGSNRVSLYTLSATNWAIGDTLDGTAALITQTNGLPPYFDGSFTDCSWAGTANNSSSYNAPNVAASLTFTADPHGQAVTLPVNARIQQTVERANVATGSWALSAALSGTAAMRVYNVGTASAARPAFAASPVIATLDGTDDVIVEFTGGASGGTVDQVKFEAGGASTAYLAENLDDELRRCRRFYYRLTGATASSRLAFNGMQGTTTTGEATVAFPVQMRTTPVVGWSSVIWDDHYSFNATISSVVLYPYVPTTAEHIELLATFAAAGAVGRVGGISSTAAGGYLEFDAELK